MEIPAIGEKHRTSGTPYKIWIISFALGFSCGFMWFELVWLDFCDCASVIGYWMMIIQVRFAFSNTCRNTSHSGKGVRIRNWKWCHWFHGRCARWRGGKMYVMSKIYVGLYSMDDLDLPFRKSVLFDDDNYWSFEFLIYKPHMFMTCYDACCTEQKGVS